MSSERAGVEVEQVNNLPKIGRHIITKFSKKFGLTEYQTDRVKTIVDNPVIQEATKEYSRYMAEYREKTNITKRYEDEGFRILHRLRGIINAAHPITIAQPDIYYAAVSAMEHAYNKVED